MIEMPPELFAHGALDAPVRIVQQPDVVAALTARERLRERMHADMYAAPVSADQGVGGLDHAVAVEAIVPVDPLGTVARRQPAVERYGVTIGDLPHEHAVTHRPVEIDDEARVLPSPQFGTESARHVTGDRQRAGVPCDVQVQQLPAQLQASRQTIGRVLTRHQYLFGVIPHPTILRVLTHVTRRDRMDGRVF